MSARWTPLSSRKAILSSSVAAFVPGCSRNWAASARVGTGGISLTSLNSKLGRLSAVGGWAGSAGVLVSAESAEAAFCQAGMEAPSLAMLIWPGLESDAGGGPDWLLD